ncbi:MAG: IMP dehydrogenase [Candidatus Sumerlaeota bacterium]|nr:IMP dehydrogenase [Candidatus Sumerlaeota bacterium]
MNNPHLDEFMEQFKFIGLTYDDVSLVTRYADFLPAEACLETRLTRDIRMNIPFSSAAMDTVTGAGMAIAMAMQGGIGIIHRNLEPLDQKRKVRRVKYYLNGFLEKARTLTPDDTIESMERQKAQKEFTFSSFPVLDKDRKLAGVVTSHQLKYCEDPQTKIADIMITKPVSAAKGTTIEQAYQIMMRNRITILPVLDEAGIFQGMYCFKDVRDILRNQNPIYNRDSKHRLRCGAAVGVKDHQRADLLAEAQVDVMVVDTAHGHTKGVMEMVRWIKQHYPEQQVIAGNVATADATHDLIQAGADGVKVGIGPGSICTTRVVAGVGVPQLTAVYECARAAQGAVPIVADGGIRYSGDVAKALAAGADSVMMGGILAGTDESPGEKILFQGRQFVSYRGMGSLEAMKTRQGSRERYAQGDVSDPDKLVPEGIEGMVPYRGSAPAVLAQFTGGLRSSLGYTGCRTIAELQEKARFVRVTASGQRESHPHDVRITKEAPNYQVEEV